MANGLEELGRELLRSPDEKNWERFEKAIKKSDVAYYRPFFGKGRLKNTQDLKNSYVELYDGKNRIVARVPIFLKKGKNFRGATMYLKGLRIRRG